MTNPPESPNDVEKLKTSIGSLPEQLTGWFENLGLTEGWSVLAANLTLMVGIVVLAFLVHLAARRVVLGLLEAGIKRSKVQWDDKLAESNVFKWLAHWVPALIVYLLAPVLLGEAWPMSATILRTLAQIYMVIVGVLAVDSLLNAIQSIARDTNAGKGLPLTSFFQVIKLIIYIAAVFLALATLTGRDALALLGGLGVAASILMLVFKDSILGLVAGIQLAGNKMISPGDWISMPSHDADGDVLSVGLTTVKVQNWDKTVTTLPTYALVNESFKNWRGMQESGGRRIKRSLHIDVGSIQFCTGEMLERFRGIEYIRDYLEAKKSEVEKWNREHGVDESIRVNGRKLTNIGTFRAYAKAYLENHPAINQDMTLLVRQLQPDEHGLPIEIYCFSSDKRWAHYESIQSDIFDHLLAVAPEFDLRVFQNPGGADVRALVKESGSPAGP